MNYEEFQKAILSINRCGRVLTNLLDGYASDPSTGKLSWLVVGPAILVGLTAVFLAASAVSIFLWLGHRIFGSQKSITVIASGLMMVAGGWLIALAHLFPLNWVYLRHGKVKTTVAPGRRV